MDSVPKVDELYPTPPPFFLPDGSQSGQDVRIYQIHSPFSPPPPPSFSFSPGVGCSTQTHTSLSVSALPLSTPRPKFVAYERELYRSPALTTCPSCQTRVTTQVTYKVGAWMLPDSIICELFQGCLSHLSSLSTSSAYTQEDMLYMNTQAKLPIVCVFSP
ncbi:cell death-inducing p53-target protein 1-like isoform X2 [Micropterus dolomieu]|uniref:cell death-inducing p53-target protein 1-like isoform X2 n=1 Tax=Micropterus dolomieu TaxID=147949 RepID=UPI001E8DE580|nr:cell death-inducing p53-target protein 1-like isoform X2 [Micropterus dolomieu]